MQVTTCGALFRNSSLLNGLKINPKIITTRIFLKKKRKKKTKVEKIDHPICKYTKKRRNPNFANFRTCSKYLQRSRTWTFTPFSLFDILKRWTQGEPMLLFGVLDWATVCARCLCVFFWELVPSLWEFWLRHCVFWVFVRFFCVFVCVRESVCAEVGVGGRSSRLGFWGRSENGSGTKRRIWILREARLGIDRTVDFLGSLNGRLI